MSFSAKTFLKTYGAVGVSVYGAVTVVSVGTMYLALRGGRADHVITAPLQAVLGSESETLKNIQRQLGEASRSSIKDNDSDDNNDNQGNFHWAREGTYLGIASVIDSLILPLKLAVCLPIARAVLKRRGR